MSHFTIQVLYPIWIGICGNLILAGLNLACRCRRSPLAREYVENSTPIMVGMWIGLAGWAVWNGIRAW